MYDLPNPERPVVVLIDGLDEATYHGRNDLAEFLADEARSFRPGYGS